MPSEVQKNARMLDEHVCAAMTGVLGAGRLDLLEVATVENSPMAAEIELRGGTADRASIWNDYNLATRRGDREIKRAHLGDTPTECVVLTTMLAMESYAVGKSTNTGAVFTTVAGATTRTQDTTPHRGHYKVVATARFRMRSASRAAEGCDELGRAYASQYGDVDDDSRI